MQALTPEDLQLMGQYPSPARLMEIVAQQTSGLDSYLAYTHHRMLQRSNNDAAQVVRDLLRTGT